jgi:hypothetical protein
MKKQARSSFDNDIALFLYVEPVVDATRFESEARRRRYGMELALMMASA